MKKVFLHGELGNKFGKEWNLDVRSPFEAVSALFANNPKIEKYIHKKESQGIYYGIKKIAKGNFLEQGEAFLQTDSDIHFVPTPKGAGFAGTLVMSAVTTAASMYVSKKLAEAAERDTGTLSVQTESFLFDGVDNRYKQGSTVPLGYGRMKVGTNVISSSIVNYDYDSEKGKLFDFEDGLQSLIPSYSKYYIEELGELFSSFMLNLFDGTSKFRSSDPLFQSLKENLADTYFGANDGIYGGYKDQETKKNEVVGTGTERKGSSTGGYYYYTYNWFKGIGEENVAKMGTILTGGNWRPFSKAGENFKVLEADALISSFVCLQSIPLLTTSEKQKEFYPISFVKEGSIEHIEEQPKAKDGSKSMVPVIVGQRFRGGSKANGVGWFKFESASIYKGIDMICEGPIEGLCNKDGETLEFNKNVEKISDPDNPKFFRNSDDDYLQGVFLNETPVKEVNLNTNKDAYNINEFDIDVAKKQNIIGGNDQELLEPQYLFTAHTVQLNQPLYGPREINIKNLNSNLESIDEFQKGKTYQKGDYVLFKEGENEHAYRIDRSLANKFDQNENYSYDANSKKIIHIGDSPNAKFYEINEALGQYNDFDESKSDYTVGDKVKTSDSENKTRYYLMGSDASDLLGSFDENQSYINQDNKILFDQGVAYKITGDYLNSDPVPINEFARILSVAAAGPLYSILNTEDQDIKNKSYAQEVDISPTASPELWQQIEINGVKDIKNTGSDTLRQDLIDLVFKLGGNANEQEIRKNEEEYYATHTIINPLVEEVYVTLQLDELAYIYEGDSIQVEYKIGKLWSKLLFLIGGYYVFKAAQAAKEAAAANAAVGGQALSAAAALKGQGETIASGVIYTLGAFFTSTMKFNLGETIENSGEFWPNKAKFRIKYGNLGETHYFTDIYMYGIATSGYRKDVKIYLPPNPSQKDRIIKVYKLNRERNPIKEGEQAARYKEKMKLAAVTEISPVHLNYPNSVIIGTRVNARDTGDIPTRNYHLKLKKIALPNNYTAETRHYDGNWDGKFYGQSEVDGEIPEESKQWSDNPAWCMYDLISNKRYGVGRFGINHEHIDKWTLYRIAKYCDEFIPTGYSPKYQKRNFSVIGDKKISIKAIGSFDDADFKKEFAHINKKLAFFYDHGVYESIKIISISDSGQEITLQKAPMQENGMCATEIDYPLVEPRYTLNAFIMNSQNAFKLINEFASIFRSYAYWSGGSINFFQDQKKESVMLFSNNNVSEDGFVYSGTPKTTRVNSCKIKYLDRYNMYRPKMEHSEDRESIKENNILEKTLDGFGITSQSQAKRATEFLVKTSNMETETVAFRTNSLGSYLRPGDVVDVLDSKRTIGRFAGKVIDVTVQGDAKSAEIKLDYPINSVIDPDDRSTWKQISLYYTSGNETIKSLNEIGVPSDQEIKNMRAAQIKNFTAIDLYENDTKVKIVPESPYSFVSGQYNWVEALIDAENKSGVLATIEDDADQALVAAVLPKNEMAWIGGHYITEPEPAKFIWHQSEDCDNNEIKYFDWAEEQPTNLINEDEKYISVTGSFRPEEHGDWVTLSGDIEQGYILEKQADDSLFNLRDIEGSTFILEDGVNLAIPKQYKIINIKESSNGTFEIQGIEYNDKKFENIETDASLDAPKYPVIFTEKNIDAPEGVKLEMLHDDPGNFIPYGLKSSWEMVLAAATYKVQYFNENVLLATFEIDNDKNSAIITHEYRSEKIFENGNYYVRVYSIPA